MSSICKNSRRKFIKNTSFAIAGITFSKNFAIASKKETLNLYTWDSYLGENTLENFKKEKGIKVNIDFFSSNTELLAKLTNKKSGYDIILPTNSFIEIMIKEDLLEKLDHNLIPNFKNISKEWKNKKFDPTNEYSIPYMFGVMGLGYRKSKVDENTINDMKWVLDSDKYSKRISWLNEPSVMIETAVKYLGGDPLKVTDENLIEAEKLLTKQKKHVKVIAEDNGQDLLLSKEVDLAIEYNGDILQVKEDDGDIMFTIPKNGSSTWLDCLAIPKNAPNKKNAHKYLNYILDPSVNIDIAEHLSYATPNDEAIKLASNNYKNDPIKFPPKKILKDLFLPNYVSKEYYRKIDDIWTRILSS